MTTWTGLGRRKTPCWPGTGELRAVLADHPEITQYQGSLASMLSELGRVRVSLGRLDDAGRDIDEAIAVSRRFLDRHPKAVHERGDLARLLGNIADLRVKVGRLRGRRRQRAEALELRRQVAAADPSVSRTTYDVVNSLQFLDSMLRKLGRSDEAEEMIREAVARHPPGAHHPEVAGYASQLSESTARLARVLDRPGDLDRAEASYRAAPGLRPGRGSRAPGRPDIARQVTRRLIDLASSLLRSGRVAAAREALREATADVEARLGRPPVVAPSDVALLAEAAALRANACRDAGDPAEALTSATRRSPGSPATSPPSGSRNTPGHSPGSGGPGRRP